MKKCKANVMCDYREYDNTCSYNQSCKGQTIESNREHFFGDKLIADTVMLLTYDNHQRAECRLFKKTLKEMSPKELKKWLDEPIDKRFNW